MIANFLRVSQEELDSYLKDSSLLEDRIYDDEREDEDPYLLDIDKAWDGILYLLTGKGVEEIDFSNSAGLHCAIFSGQMIDPEQDLGYGPAHYLTPNQVKSISNALLKKDKDDLYKVFNPEDMTDKEIYPEIWEDEGDEAFDYLYTYFQQLQQFYDQAASEDQAVISILN
ncbi:DUF1877 family protein [Dysgonomonas sp. 520]|nr:DUF1877 family protein [Dysgonomonas sp. 520]